MTTLACARCKEEFTADKLEGKFGGLCPRCVFRSVVGDGDLAAMPEGVQFGNYLLLGVLGTGGMGIVYKARQKGLDRMVALKILPGGKDAPAEMVERFFREARAAANLQHPHIVPIHEVAGHEGAYYYSMDLVDGRSFSEILHDRQAAIRGTLEILCKVARAVHYAHERGIIHRDLKPANIMVDRDGEPKVLDFGVAKILSTQSLATTHGSVLGTPPYMSPEQAAGAKDLDPRTDVYSLGAILYEALTGRPPHTGESAMEVYRKIATERPVSPTKVNPQTPRALETICLKALARDRADRYASAQSFADDLRRYLDGKAIDARPIRSNRKAASRLFAIFGLCFGLATGITWLVLELRVRHRRQEHQQELKSATAALAEAKDLEAELRALETLKLRLRTADTSERAVYFEAIQRIFLAPLGRLLEQEMSYYRNKEGWTLQDLDKLSDLTQAYQILCGKIALDDDERGRTRNTLIESRYVRESSRPNLWLAASQTPMTSTEPMNLAVNQLGTLLQEFAAPDAPRIRSHNAKLVEEVNKCLGSRYWHEAAYVNVRKVWEQSWTSQYPNQGQNIFSDAAGSDRLKANHTVPGFFTQNCFHGYIQPQFKEHAEAIARKYEKARIEGTAKDVEDYLYERYKGEYAGEWNRFIEEIEVLPFGSVRGARDSLQTLCGAVSTNPAIAKIITEVWSRRVITIDGTAWNVPKRGTEWLKLANDKLVALAKTLDEFVKKTQEGRRFRGYVDNENKIREKVDLGEAFNSALSEIEDVVGRGIDPQDRFLRDAAMKFLLAPVHRARDAFQQEAREEMNRYWSETALAHFQKGLAGKYPLVRDAAADASIQDFNKFFKPDSGLFAQAAHYLKALNDITINEKPLVKYTPEYEAALAYAQRTQVLLYSLDKNTVSTQFTVQSTSPQEYGHVMLKVTGRQSDFDPPSFHEPYRAVWEGGASVFFKLTSENRPSKVFYEDKQQTYWGLFRLCDSGGIKDKGTGKDFEMSWEYLPGLRITLTLTCDDRDNPFAPDFFSKFECPEKVAGD